MSDFDEQILRDRLQRLGGRLPDEDAAYAALQHRVRAAKRRRGGIASATLAVLCVLGLVVAVLPGRNHQTVTTATNQVAGPDDSPDGPGSSTTATTAKPLATTASTDSTDSTTSTAPSASTSSTEDPLPSVVQPDQPKPGAEFPNNTTSTDSGPSNTTGTSTKGTTAHTSSPAPTASPATPVPGTDNQDTGMSSPPAGSGVETRTFAAAHGSITVQLQDGRLTLLGQQPADGYTFSLDRNDPDRIRVRFRGDQATSQIDVSIAAGHIVGIVLEQASGQPGATTPAVPSPDTSTSGGSSHT